MSFVLIVSVKAQSNINSDIDFKNQNVTIECEINGRLWALNFLLALWLHFRERMQRGIKISNTCGNLVFNVCVSNFRVKFFIGEKKTGDECLDGLKKFGKIVGYIISGVILITILCCCACWCLICKAIHSNKHRTRGGQVFVPNNNPVITTVA
jgi:hypothetical protein